MKISEAEGISKVKPPSFTLLSGNGLNRLTLAQACSIVTSMLYGRMTIKYTSKLQGAEPCQWVECQADSDKSGYTFAFGVKENRVVTLWAVLTAGGSSWDVDDKDSGNPANHISLEQWQAVTRLLLPSNEIVSVRPIWRVVVNNGSGVEKPVSRGMDLGIAPDRTTFPEALMNGPDFQSAEEAESAAEQMRAYLAACLAPKAEKVKPAIKFGKGGRIVSK